MIATQLSIVYNHHVIKIQHFLDNIFVADYTEQTKSLAVKRGVEFFSPNPPLDINFFSIINTTNLSVAGIDFDEQSFVCGNGNTLTQCESVFFPSLSTITSWILFCELKYSSKPLNNHNNLRKAIKQLYKTRYYYYQRQVISSSNPSYLIASLPLQAEPFPNFIISQPTLIKLKVKRNIILRFKNTVEIQDSNIVLV
jgi:hypothetical protein